MGRWDFHTHRRIRARFGEMLDGAQFLAPEIENEFIGKTEKG